MAFTLWLVLNWILIVMVVMTLRCSIIASKSPNERPIIGIPTMKISDGILLKKVPKLKGREYIASSYVKLIEMTGARAIPIPIQINDTQLKHVFKSINGLLFPGGETNLEDSGYYKVTKKLYEYAVKENEKGIVFPILGICRGMQALIVHTVGSIDDMQVMDAVNLSTSLKWSNENFQTSFLKDMPTQMKDDAEKYNLTAHFHKYSFDKGVFSKASVKERYEVIATSMDRNKKEFVSILQGRKLPFFGVQFHPEKVLFEWAETLRIPHTERAIYFSQYLANTFMAEVRKNNEHHFKDPQEEQLYSMLKDPMYYTGFLPESHSPFMQIYVY